MSISTTMAYLHMQNLGKLNITSPTTCLCHNPTETWLVKVICLQQQPDPDLGKPNIEFSSPAASE